jgi:glycosyltransferase involved in cell wall biosynthesis
MVKVVSAVHKSLFLRKDNYYINEESNQGILHFVPNASFIQNEIPNGFDIQTFSILTPWKDRIPNSFISISASLDNPVRMKLKGIDMVLELAKRFPDSIFTLVGAKNPGTLNIPPNVQLIPFVPNEELPQIYNTHKFYLQLSISEGFPNALCEAMACGCIPIVSEVASMPEIVGNNGLKIPSRDIKILESLIKSYVDQPELDAVSTKASASISERYPIQLRKTEMLKLVDSL